MSLGLLCAVSHGSVPQFPHLQHGGKTQIFPSHPPPRWAQTQKSRRHCLPKPPFQTSGFWAALSAGRGSLPSDRCPVPTPARPGGNPSQQLSAAAWSSGSSSPLGRPPRQADGRGGERPRQLLLSLADDTECKFCWQHSLLPLHATSFNHCN